MPSVDDCEAVHKIKGVLEDQLEKLKEENEKYRIQINSLIFKHENLPGSQS